MEKLLVFPYPSMDLSKFLMSPTPTVEGVGIIPSKLSEKYSE
jgi:hypothetical protein